MKGLNKIALVSAIAAASFGAQAELKALDDSAMGELTGQAGLTIDIETKWTMGEFAYQDAGFVVLKDLSMGGNSNEAASPFFTAHGGFLDNIRLTLDVAGDGGAVNGTLGDNVSSYGMSEVKHLAAKHVDAGSTAQGFNDAAAGAAAGPDMFAGLSTFEGEAIDDERISGDGDLTLHFGFTDAWQKGGGYLAYATGKGSDGLGGQTNLAGLGFDQAVEILKKSVDFEFNIGQIALASSGYNVGNGVIEGTVHETRDASVNVTALNGTDATPETTTLISDLSVKGYLGPMDIIIENKGNGFNGGKLGAGTGNADSKILWDSYFKVTDLDLYIDIAGVQLTDIQIHNDRGDTTGLNVGAAGATSSLGFAHSKREIYAVKDDILNGGIVDGIAIDTRFKGDIDIGAISFGNTGKSVGKIFMTDVQSTTNWRISAH